MATFYKNGEFHMPTLEEDLDSNGFDIIITNAPDSATKAANKEYVDLAAQGSNFTFMFNDTPSDIGGIYSVMDQTATGEAESTFTTAGLGIAPDQPLANFATIVGEPTFLDFEAGVYDTHLHAEVTVGGRDVILYAEFYKRAAGGAETLLFTSELSEVITAKTDISLHFTIPDDFSILSTDRLVVKWYANVTGGGANVTIVLYAEGTNASRFEVKAPSGANDSRYLRLAGGDMSGALNTARATVASHATTSAIWVAAGNIINFTGAETITDFPAAPQAGAWRILECAGAAIFTHAGNITVQGNATFTAEAGDHIFVSAISTTTFDIKILPQDGLPLVSLPAANVTGTAVTLAGAETLTNKRVTPRVLGTTSSATPTINTDNTDIYQLTAQSEAITSFTTNLSGTPIEGDVLIIEVTGTASRAITWGASFEASTVDLPTTTVDTDKLTVGFLYNAVAGKWRVVGVA